MNKLLYKTITADTQVSTQECYFVGAQIVNTTNTSMVIYDRSSNAARKIATVKSTTYPEQGSMIFPSGGVHCQGIYVDWDAGTGTVWYHY